MYTAYLKSKKKERSSKTQNAGESSRGKSTKDKEVEEDSATDNDDQSHGGDASWEEVGSESGSHKEPVTALKRLNQTLEDNVEAERLSRKEGRRLRKEEKSWVYKTKKENKIRDRAIAKKQAVADALLSKQTRLSNLYFTQTGRDKTDGNMAAVLNIVQDGGITGINELHETMDQYSTYTEGVTGQDPVIDQEAYNALEGTTAVTQMDDGALTTLKPVTRDPELRTAEDGTNIDITPYKSGDTQGEITFTGKKPEDISKALAGIKTAEDWTAANNVANAMEDGEIRTRILAALEGIKTQFIVPDGTSDQSDYFAGLKTSADFDAKKRQIEAMPESDLKTNRMARYNEMLQSSEAAQVVQDTTGNISDWFSGITTNEQWLSKKTEADSMSDGILKNRYLKQLEKISTGRDFLSIVK